jgi:hypothetical protein
VGEGKFWRKEEIVEIYSTPPSSPKEGKCKRRSHSFLTLVWCKSGWDKNALNVTF